MPDQPAARIGSSTWSGVRPSLANSAASASSPALAAVSSLSPVKMQFAPARKHSAWVVSRHAFAARRQADHRLRHGDPRGRDSADEFDVVDHLSGCRQHVAEDGALDRHERVDRHAFGMARRGSRARG